jgi:hypothetical protein
MGLSFGDINKTTNSSQNTSTTSNPWAPAIPALTGLINTASSTPTGVTPAQTGAFSTLLSNAAQGDPGAGLIQQNAKTQLGTGNQTGTVNNALSAETADLTPIANGSETNLATNPQVQGLLNTIQQQTTNAVNQQFAGAGRSNSGQNAEAIALGLSQGEAAPLLNEYNVLQGNQINAAEGLGNATNAATATNAGLTAAQIGAQDAGVATDQAGIQAANYAPTQALNIGEQQTALPFQNMGLLASILAPLAGLGGTSNSNSQGTSVTNGTSFGGNTASFSDERLKEDKREVGMLHDGTPIHSWRYKGDPVTHVGPMAQEVEKRAPEAVGEVAGYKTVDMKKATDRAAAIVRERAAKRRKAA